MIDVTDAIIPTGKLSPALPGVMFDRFKGNDVAFAVAFDNHGKVGFRPSTRSLTPEILRKHLVGEVCLGFYILDSSDRCFCSCVDIDDHDGANPDWKNQAAIVWEFLIKGGFDPIIEISQSGSGAHVWLFHGEPIDAWRVRAFWGWVGKQTGQTFNEIFPKQPRHTGKGFGNLVRFPLWAKSEFVTGDSFDPLGPMDALEYTERVTCEAMTDLAESFGVALNEENPPIPGCYSPSPPNPIPSIDNTEILSDRVKRAISSGILERRWNGDGSGLKDSSKSGLVMSITCELIRRFIPTDEIEIALTAWLNRNGATDRVERADWIPRTIAKGYDFVIQRMEQPSTNLSTLENEIQKYVTQLETGGLEMVSTGIQALDESVEGIALGELAFAAGRPGHGKSVFGLQFVSRAASDGIKSLLISEEMSGVQIGKRKLLTITRIPSYQWDVAVVDRLRQDICVYADENETVYFAEQCGTIERVEEVIEQCVSLNGVKVVCVDYLQIVTMRQMMDRRERVAEIVNRLKRIAGRLGIALLVLSQMNREIDGRPKAIPIMSDLADSSEIEKAADHVWFLQWPHVYNENASLEEYNIFVAKKRNGEVKRRRLSLRFNPEFQAIS